MRYNKRKNKLIYILIIILSGISIGYASFATKLNITGVANASGKFSIEFINGNIIDSQGINLENSFAIISDSKDTLSIKIADMAYPGAGATVSCLIKNTGTIPAKITDVKFYGNTDPDITISFPDTMAIGQKLQPLETVSMCFVVKWDIQSTLQYNKEINFSAEILYEQDVTEYVGTVK